jgi:hypothetical protein
VPARVGKGGAARRRQRWRSRGGRFIMADLEVGGSR